MNAGSASLCTAVRCDTRRAAIASGRVLPRSNLSTNRCSTVVMIVAPPGEPSATTGLPWRVTIVGENEEPGRLAGSTRVGCVVEARLKSVISLWSRQPQPGTTMPEPPVDSIVNVYDATLPLRSATVRCVVDRPFSASAPPGATTALAG